MVSATTYKKGGGKSKFGKQAGHRPSTTTRRVSNSKVPSRHEKAKEELEREAYLEKRRGALKAMQGQYIEWATATAEMMEEKRVFEPPILNPDGTVDMGDTFKAFTKKINVGQKMPHRNPYLGLSEFFRRYKGLKARYGRPMLIIFLLSLLASIATRYKQLPDYKHILPEHGKTAQNRNRANRMAKWVGSKVKDTDLDDLATEVVKEATPEKGTEEIDEAQQDLMKALNEVAEGEKPAAGGTRKRATRR